MPNASLRNREHRVPSDLPPPPVVVFDNSLPLDLYYLVTVGTTPGDERGERCCETLGGAMQALQLDPELTGPGVGYETVHVSLEPLTTEETSRIWALFPTANYRTSIAYLATPGLDRSEVAGNGRRAGGEGQPRRGRPRHIRGDVTMARRFEVRLPLERAYTREAKLAVELLDAVTLERVSQGVEVTTDGLSSKPKINSGGLFVWVNEDVTQLVTLSIKPHTLPFEAVEIPGAQVTRPLHRVELQPLASYPFAPGFTAIRGSLYESRPPAGATPVPIAGATIRLEWLDDDGATWRPWHAPALTNAAGDFTAILRLARGQQPRLDAVGKMTVQLFARRANGQQKQSTFQLTLGRVADETYAWDELL